MPSITKDPVKNDSAGTEPSMELRLFMRLSLWSAACTFLVILPVDCLLQFPLSITLVDLGFGSAALFLYRGSLRGRQHPRALFPLFLFALNIVWFLKGASQGSIIFYFFALFVCLMIFLRDRGRLLMLGAAITNGVGLLMAEGYFPQWVVPYRGQGQRLADLATSFTVSALSCAIMLYAVLASHDREQRRLTNLNDDLMRTIAERKEVEKRLQDREERLSLVLRGSSDGFWDWNLRENSITYSQRWWEMLGYVSDEITVHPDLWYSMMHPVDQPHVAQRFRDAFCGDAETFEMEFRLQHKEGHYVPMVSRAVILRDPDGKPTRVCGTNTDITRRRSMEQQLLQHQNELELANQLLEERIKERTADLESSLCEQQAFSYTVSHDLRAPLRHINSFSAIIVEDHLEALPAAVCGYLERISEASNRMGELIDHLLELSRVSLRPVALESVDLSALARQVFAMHQDIDPTRCAKTTIADGIVVWGDASLLRLLLENLLGNAWKYSSGRSCAHIEFGATRVDGEEAIFVRDNGAGFDMAYAQRLFAPFERLHGSEFEGTGIGLATAQRIVRRHGGKIWAQGKVGEGACFFFTLPVHY
jgi:PAS domain S-box-containing protein